MSMEGEMAGGYSVSGHNTAASFTLKIHRGDGMALLAMDWRKGTPSNDFVGFAIEYRPPGRDRFYPLKNRLAFPGAGGTTNPNILSTRLSPIQKWRWVHFPWIADAAGAFRYRVTPVFMNDQDELSYGEAQEADIELRRETYPGELDIAYTRGFVSSQAFVDQFESKGPISTLLPDNADAGLTFVPTHPLAKQALVWMGFEVRQRILDVLEGALSDAGAQVRVVAYDLNEPNVVSRLQALGPRLRIIIDDSEDHGKAGSAENQAAALLTAKGCSVKRQHMGNLQHNKTIVVDGPAGRRVVCGSTNFSWRGFYVQNNNALILDGAAAIKPFVDAFDDYWTNETPKAFGPTPPAAAWNSLGLAGIDAAVTFSPHAASNARLDAVAADVAGHTTSSLFYSLAFLYQTTKGSLYKAIKKISSDNDIFVYGISDRKVGGLDLQKPNTNVAPVYPSQLSKGLPEPFKSEPTGGSGIRMHHKFIVVDFDKPTARVYLGSYNFSTAADRDNGENLVLIRDRRVAVSYMIEALTIFDHYHFRVAQKEARTGQKKLQLAKPPRNPGEKPWWDEDFSDPHKIRDRELFA
jgi:phosphatidylserine/phosphatidylglycerophosphate/cardiolipin synthase-like enzyme